MLRAIVDFVRLPHRAQHVLGVNARNLTLVRRYNPRRFYPLADDKLRTKELLEAAGVPVPVTLAVFSSLIEAAHAAAKLEALPEFVVKPASGRAGNGILVLVSRTEGGWVDHSSRLWKHRDVNQHVSNIIFGNYAHGLSDRAFAEERLIQAPLVGSRALPGLPDIRVITLRGVPLLAMMRLPTSRSHGKANLHQGAIGVGIDLESGRTVSATFRGRAVERHPDTNAALVGQSIARWPDILDVASRAARALPLGFLGVDVAIDARRGPVILEANVRPGLEIQNANQRGLRALAAAAERGAA